MPPVSIEEKYVRTALQSMIHFPGPRTTNPLETLHSVKLLLAHSGLSECQLSTRYVLHTLLIRLITEEFYHHRRLVGRFPPPDQATMDIINREIICDGQTRNRELIGWSWLYHHYVRVELDMTSTHFERLITSDPRTLRRYKKLAIQRLTRRLLEEEYRTRPTETVA